MARERVMLVKLRKGIFLVPFLGIAILAAAQSPAKTALSVPFVGCRADGQAGPMSAPNDKARVLPVSGEAARQLAYYKSFEGLGVLAPRGWYCFQVYGSNGGELYVGPHPITAANVYSGGFDGPIIELAGESGDTSGRFGVARTIARVFPAHRGFVENVIEEGIEPASSFPFGPFPSDKLLYRGNEMVEYQTPANTDGLGTSSRLRKNASRISGVAMLLGQTPDLLQLSVRLPSNLADLASTIVQQAERDAMHVADNQ
jgi:hypothetical protein